jgi:hypothetical protein
VLCHKCRYCITVERQTKMGTCLRATCVISHSSSGCSPPGMNHGTPETPDPASTYVHPPELLINEEFSPHNLGGAPRIRWWAKRVRTTAHGRGISGPGTGAEHQASEQTEYLPEILCGGIQ